jgi:serine protease Do
VAKLAEQFLCVRIQSMNGVNINLFQFDGDLTWMSFFMDANDRFYARYGGREDSSAESLLSKESLLRTMGAVLFMREFGIAPAVEDQPPAKPVQTPEDIPRLKARMAKRKEGQRCIHCHEVKQAQLQELQRSGRFSKEMIFSYPQPSVFGIHLDCNEQRKIWYLDFDTAPGKRQVIAQNGWLQPFNEIQKVNGHRVLTAADFAWILERLPKEGELKIEFRAADGKTHYTTFKLKGNWRESEDPSWRSSTYVAGPNAGFWAEPLSERQRKMVGLANDALALRVTVFFGDHPTPRKAGLRINDVIVEFDGKRRPITVRQLHTHCQMKHDYGDKVPMTVLRGGKAVKLVLELPREPAKLE